MPPPPIGDIFCPAAGYALEYDSIDGDKCRGAGAAGNWTPTVGCQDSLYVIPTLNGPGRAPRVLADTCFKSEGHSEAWGNHVEQCRVQTVEEGGNVARHAATVLFNERTGQEVEVMRVINWGHATVWLFILCYNSSLAPSSYFTVGDTINVRKPTRTAPSSVLPGSASPCDVSLLKPPAAPPAPPIPPQARWFNTSLNDTLVE